MTYETALEKIHSLLTFGSRPGLDRMRALLHRMGDPQDKLRYIHVAGTNGKGSVCAVLSSVLAAAGYKTGLFISPADGRGRHDLSAGGAAARRGHCHHGI